MRSPSVGSSPGRPWTVRQLRPRRTRALGSDGGASLAAPTPAAPIPAIPARAISARDTAFLLVVIAFSSFRQSCVPTLLRVRWRWWRRQTTRVEDTAEHVRPIRVTPLERHDHLVVDLGKPEHATVPAGE